MRRLEILLSLGLLIGLTGCLNEHASFCEQASTKLCAKCATCGSFAACGLTDVTNEADCQKNFFRICEAYEPDYNREVARHCLQDIETSPCSAPKPEVCSKLF